MTSPAISFLFSAPKAVQFRSLSSNILREIATYLPAPLLLPAVHSPFLITYNVHSACYRYFPIDPEFLPSHSIFCLLDSVTAVAVSGDEPSTKVVRVSLVSGRISPFPNMLQSRILPGIIAISGNLYTFGGLLFRHHLKKAEKFSISSQTWKRLADSNKAHHSFCPCYHKGIIYLSPSRIYHNFETFTTASEIFKMIDLKGDTSFLRPVSIIVADCLFVIGTNGYLVRWEVGAGSAEVGTLEGRFGQIFAASCSPVVKDREVLWMDLTQQSLWTLMLDLQFLYNQRFALPG